MGLFGSLNKYQGFLMLSSHLIVIALDYGSGSGAAENFTN
jgi:hypothetical protein